MFQIEASVVIAAPVEEVFEWIEHPERHQDWQHSLVEIRRTGHTTGVEVRKFLGRRSETHFEVVEHVQNQTLRRQGRSAGHMPISYSYDQRYLFEPAESGTKVTVQSEIQVPGVPKLAMGTIERVARHDAEVQLRHLKELVEAHDDVHALLEQTKAHR